MSYQKTYEYEIAPEESYSIIRNCSICGCKSVFVNTNNFRVNANGNRIDVWLIYQCSKCKHTYNLTIFERQKVEQFSSDYFKSLMNNEKELAKKYGTDKSYFVKNKAEIEWNSVRYQIINTKTRHLAVEESIILSLGDIIQINNPCGLKIRNDKIMAEIFHISRKIANQLEETGYIKIVKNNLSLSIYILKEFNT